MFGEKGVLVPMRWVAGCAGAHKAPGEKISGPCGVYEPFRWEIGLFSCVGEKTWGPWGVMSPFGWGNRPCFWGASGRHVVFLRWGGVYMYALLHFERLVEN